MFDVDQAITLHCGLRDLVQLEGQSYICVSSFLFWRSGRVTVL